MNVEGGAEQDRRDASQLRTKLLSGSRGRGQVELGGDIHRRYEGKNVARTVLWTALT
jgi:hypothetical protein